MSFHPSPQGTSSCHQDGDRSVMSQFGPEAVTAKSTSHRVGACPRSITPTPPERRLSLVSGAQDAISVSNNVAHLRNTGSATASTGTAASSRQQASFERRVAWLEEDVAVLHRRMQNDCAEGNVAHSQPSSGLMQLVKRLDEELAAERLSREALQARVLALEEGLSLEQYERRETLKGFSQELEFAIKALIGRIDHGISTGAAALRERTQSTEHRLRSVIARVDEGLAAAKTPPIQDRSGAHETRSVPPGSSSPRQTHDRREKTPVPRAEIVEGPLAKLQNNSNFTGGGSVKLAPRQQLRTFDVKSTSPSQEGPAFVFGGRQSAEDVLQRGLSPGANMRNHTITPQLAGSGILPTRSSSTGPRARYLQSPPGTSNNTPCGANFAASP